MADRAKERPLRRRAEKLISPKQESPPPPAKKSSEEMKKLIYELQVHQIELEMQNDELRKAREEIETYRRKYVDLYDFAPVGYFTLDAKGVILEANLTGAALLGMERGLLLKTPFSLFIMPDDRDLFRDCQRKVFQIPGRQICELRLKPRENDPLWVSLESMAVEDSDGRLAGIRMAIMHISDRKMAEKEVLRLNAELEAKVTERTVQLEAANKILREEIARRERAEQEIRQSEKEFRGIFESSSVAMIERDASTGQRLHVNPRLCEMTGYSAKELLNEKDLILTHPDDRERDQIFKRGVLKGKSTNWVSEKRYVRKDGEVIWVHVNGRLIRDSSGQPYRTVAVIQDITERKLAEEALMKAKDELEIGVRERTEELVKSQERLRYLASQLLLAQEKERKRVAVELHDALLSELAAVKYLLEGKVMLLEKGKPVDPGELRRVADILGGVMKEARKLMNNLHPSTLDALGVITTMEWLCAEYQKTYPHFAIQKKITVSEDDIRGEIKVVIYRVLQEALNNFARHGRGDVVDLSLSKSDGTIALTIRDNGQGFDLGTVQKGLGLESMRERVEISGGTFHIESTIGKGTTIRAIWHKSA